MNINMTSIYLHQIYCNFFILYQHVYFEIYFKFDKYNQKTTRSRHNVNEVSKCFIYSVQVFEYFHKQLYDRPAILTH